MKLQSEISIGWVIVYAVILASLSGKNSSEFNPQQSGNQDIYQKNSIPYDSKFIENVRGSSNEAFGRNNRFTNMGYQKNK